MAEEKAAGSTPPGESFEPAMQRAREINEQIMEMARTAGHQMLDAYVRSHPSDELKLFAVTTEGSVPDSKLRPLANLLSFPLATRISGPGYGPVGGAVPSNFVIDRGGVVRYANKGAFTKSSFAALVGPLLAAPAPGGVITA